METGGLSIRLYERPDVTLRQVRYYPLKAWVCTDCGLTQLYVNQPAETSAQSYERYPGARAAQDAIRVDRGRTGSSLRFLVVIVTADCSIRIDVEEVTQTVAYVYQATGTRLSLY